MIDTILTYGSFIFLVILAPLVYGSMIVSNYSKSRFWCDKLGWHNDKFIEPVKSFDGASFHSKCTRCGKEVMMSSQGTWF